MPKIKDYFGEGKSLQVYVIFSKRNVYKKKGNLNKFIFLNH